MCRRLRKLLSILFVAFSLLAPLSAQADSSDLEEFQQLANSLSTESFSAETQQINSLMSLILEEVRSNPESNLDEQSLKELEQYESLVKSESYVQMPLSNQLRLMKDSIKKYESLTKDISKQRTTQSTWQLNVLNYMNQLFEHMSKLSMITEKIIKSQNDDLALALKEWNTAMSDLDFLKNQLSVSEALARKQAEEIEAMRRIKKRVRVASYIELGIGIPTLVIGCLPIWTSEQKNIQNLLLGIGGSMTAAGATGFIFTFTF